MAREAGVPTVPGSDGIIGSEQEAIRVAKDIGFPVLLKATAGGGGKGMRVAANEQALAGAWQQASAEALAAFGNPGIYIERYVGRARHIEVQVVFDSHGNGNSATINQLTNSNSASVKLTYDINTVNLTQRTGTGNTSLININGNWNTVNNTQTGSNNFAIVNITGDNNTATVNQTGTGHSTLLNLINAGGANTVSVTQTGNADTYSLQQTCANAAGCSVSIIRNK